MRYLFTLAIFCLAAFLSPHALGQEKKLDFQAWVEPQKPRMKDVHAAMMFLAASIKELPAPKLTRRWRKDKDYRILLLSVGQSRSPAKVIYGQGYGYRAALKELVAQLSEQPILRRAPWIKLEIVTSLAAPQLARRGKPFPLDFSFEGLANSDGRWASPPGELVAHNVYQDRVIKGDELSAALRSGGRNQPKISQEYHQPGLSLRRFRTFAYFSDYQTTAELYRDHRLVSKVTLPLLEASMDAGMTYLTNATKPSGEFLYTYLTRGKPQYSLPRHGGTLFSMAEYYRAYPQKELLEAIMRAQTFLQKEVKPFTAAEPKVPVLVERGFIKLTSMALGVLALVECYKIHEDPAVLKLAKEMALYIVHSQLPNGRFYGIRNYGDGLWRKEMEAMYAPGESIYALANLYELDPNPKWLEVAEKGAAYLMESQGAQIPLEKLDHDHWLLYGLDAIHKISPKDIYVDHAMRLTRSIENLQRKTHPQADWVGSYYTPPRSTPTATRSEGLMAAYRLALRAMRPAEALRIWDIAERSIAFQLQSQYGPENAMHFSYPHKVIGGFRGGYLDNQIRIDFVQHNVAAMLAMAQMMTAGLAPKK